MSKQPGIELIDPADQEALHKYLAGRGWKRKDAAADSDGDAPAVGWKDPHRGTRRYLNALGQAEYPSEHRVYTTDEAVAIQRAYEATAKVDAEAAAAKAAADRRERVKRMQEQGIDPDAMREMLGLDNG